MSTTSGAPQAKLNAYYAETATKYDELHLKRDDEHYVALDRTLGFARDIGVASVLDVGCGTGRGLGWYAAHLPGAALHGIDPAPELLNIAFERVPIAAYQVGVAQALAFADQSIDLVVATGILHHVEDPARCIRQMFRVARKAVLVSDHNNFAFGGRSVRRIRSGLHAIGLLRSATFVKQGFRKQGYSENDGYWYAFSLLDHYRLMAEAAKRVMIVPTRRPTGEDGNLLFCQSHMAIWAEL